MDKRLILEGDPRTKKNSQRIVVQGNKRFIMPSAQYAKYEAAMISQMYGKAWHIERPVNIGCVYYMRTRRKVDLVNLLEATMDILVKGGVIQDDCATIVVSHDGSRVLLDRERPRVEITIKGVE